MFQLSFLASMVVLFKQMAIRGIISCLMLEMPLGLVVFLFLSPTQNQKSGGAKTIIRYITGSLFIAFGVRLALSQKS